jgi:hypothetical protein
MTKLVDNQTATHTKVQKLLKKGDKFLDAESYQLAKVEYLKALELLNNDHTESNQDCKDVLLALIDVFFLDGCFQDCIEYSDMYLENSNGQINAILALRLGQSLYETEDLKGSWEYLSRAYMMGGYQLFEGEDRKYLDYIHNDQ